MPEPSTSTENPDHTTAILAKIGLIMSLWSGFELYLALILATLLRTDGHLAITIMNTLPGGARARREVVRSVARQALAEENDIKAVERLMKRASNAAQKRNILSHAMLGSHSEHRDKLAFISISTSGEPPLITSMPLSETDLERIIKQIRALSEDAFVLCQNLESAKRTT